MGKFSYVNLRVTEDKIGNTPVALYDTIRDYEGFYIALMVKQYPDVFRQCYRTWQ